jgi:glycoside/pentoside/hexuronide:cation symporter, GPH family
MAIRLAIGTIPTVSLNWRITSGLFSPITRERRQQILLQSANRRKNPDLDN